MSFFAFLMICLFPFVPESPRFMIAKGRDAEAHALLAKWHANGVMDDELVAAELLEIKETFATENASKGQSKSWRQCFATPGDRWRMFICIGLATCNNWTGQSIVSYYNTQILTQAGITATLPQLGINGGLSIFDFFCAVFGAFISGRVGRRPLFLASFIGMTAAHVVVTGLSAKYAMSHIASYGYAVIAFIWVESGFYSEYGGVASAHPQTSPSTPSSTPTRARSFPTRPAPRACPFSSSPGIGKPSSRAT
jgi:hypothetical protein